MSESDYKAGQQAARRNQNAATKPTWPWQKKAAHQAGHAAEKRRQEQLHTIQRNVHEI